MGRFETRKQEQRERQQAALQRAATDLVKLNARLGIRSVLQTTMPTTGVGAFIGVSTGHAIVPISQLQYLAAALEQLQKELDAL